MMNLPFLHLPPKNTLRLRPPRHPWSQSDRDRDRAPAEPRGVSAEATPATFSGAKMGQNHGVFMGDFRENLQETMVFMGDFMGISMIDMMIMMIDINEMDRSEMKKCWW